MSTARLFIAIRVPENDIKQWSQAQLKLKKEIKEYGYEVKWAAPGNYHVTLVFLGPTAEDKISNLQSVISSVASNYHPFKLDINGMGAFADLNHARVLYLGVQNKKILRSLQNEIIESLQLEVNHTPFLPHLSILRFRNIHEVKDLVSPFLRKKWGDIKVAELVLYKSEMRGLYPVYTPIFNAPLTGEQESEPE